MCPRQRDQLAVLFDDVVAADRIDNEAHRERAEIDKLIAAAEYTSTPASQSWGTAARVHGGEAR